MSFVCWHFLASRILADIWSVKNTIKTHYDSLIKKIFHLETESYSRGSFNQTASQSEPQERALSIQTRSGKHKLFKAHLFHLGNVIKIFVLSTMCLFHFDALFVESSILG